MANDKCQKSGKTIYHRLSGEEARPFVEKIASLRLSVFWEFPYLYEGTLEYEKKYLETYFQSKNSLIFLIEEDGETVGATTGILASDEEESFRKPFEDARLDPKKVFYFGESVLLEKYRGRGYGKMFFHERELFARELGGVNYLSFCAVVRDAVHPMCPLGYRSLDEFWISQGFKKSDQMVTHYSWRDRGEKEESSKKMQYWIKEIK